MWSHSKYFNCCGTNWLQRAFCIWSTKSALVGFTKSLARDLGRAGVTVNAVCPGFMATDMTTGLQGEKLQSIMRRSPLGRLASVEDVAYIFAHLVK